MALFLLLLIFAINSHPAQGQPLSKAELQANDSRPRRNVGLLLVPQLIITLWNAFANSTQEFKDNFSQTLSQAEEWYGQVDTNTTLTEDPIARKKRGLDHHDRPKRFGLAARAILEGFGLGTLLGFIPALGHNHLFRSKNSSTPVLPGLARPPRATRTKRSEETYPEAIKMQQDIEALQDLLNSQRQLVRNATGALSGLSGIQRTAWILNEFQNTQTMLNQTSSDDSASTPQMWLAWVIKHYSIPKEESPSNTKVKDPSQGLAIMLIIESVLVIFLVISLVMAYWQYSANPGKHDSEDEESQEDPYESEVSISTIESGIEI